VHDAANTMAQWGMISIGENWQGKTFVNLEHNPLYGQVYVSLTVGTWTQKLETIDRVSFRIKGPPGVKYLGDDVWLANLDTWQGFRLDNLLKAYGVPSYVGFFFQTIVEAGSPLEGRTISFGLEMQYKGLNLHVAIGALAFYDGRNLYLCPSKDPRNLEIEINPDSSLQKKQGFYSVSWQALAGVDLNAFYQMFTDQNNADVCITTTLGQIQDLQPDFH
jgi:hypothetical protein